MASNVLNSQVWNWVFNFVVHDRHSGKILVVLHIDGSQCCRVIVDVSVNCAWGV